MTESENILFDNLKKEKKQRPVKHLTGILKWVFVVIAVIVVGTSLAISKVYFNLSRDLPQIATLADYRPSIITSVYSDDNRKIAEFFKERRIL